MTHTPGPWKVENEHNRVVQIHAKDWFLVTNVPVRQGTSETDYANARLIAAAPQMLHLLRHSLNAIEDLSKEANISAYTKLESRIYDLIDKIEGNTL